MTWFDYVVGIFFVYFVVRGLFSGFIRSFFSLLGMVVAFLYSGWFSLKIKPFVAMFIQHPKGQIFVSFLLAFLLIYLTFVALGYVFLLILKSMHLSIGDRILGMIFGFMKGALFATFLYFLIIVPYPPAKKNLEKSFCYPVVEYTTKLFLRFIPQSWIEFIEKTRKYHEIPRVLLERR